MNISRYKRIIVIGNCGSGKSWFSRRLADITGYRLVHLDCEYWQPDWVGTPKEEWIEKNKEIIKGENWIIDGNYNSTMELRFTAANLVIFLDINRYVCIWSALRRHGKKRSDLPDYLEEKIDSEFLVFLRWIWGFKKIGRKRIMDLHEKYPEKDFLILNSRRAVRKQIKYMEYTYHIRHR